MCLTSYVFAGASTPVGADIFGIFDGHGGKQAATFVSKHLTSRLLEEVAATGASHSVQQEAAAHSQAPDPDLMATSLESGSSWLADRQPDSIPEQLKQCDSLAPEAWAAWHAQDALVDVLPDVLCSTFSSVQRDFYVGTQVTIAV